MFVQRSCLSVVTGLSRSLIAETDVVNPVALALDWRSRCLYWLDNKKGTIEVVSVDKGGQGRMRLAILKDTRLVDASDLVLDPGKLTVR